MRQVFIDSAVRVVARDGMEKTTTKAIASEANLNEAYIYKCFSGKDDLLSAALHMEDVGFAELLQKTLPVMHMPGLSWKERAYILWKRSWDFILNEPADCIFYIRYYYSASCRAHACRCGASSVDGVKRVTRAGKGLCQGRTCRCLVENIVAQETGKPVGELEYPGVRPPVRVVKLGALRGEDEEE